jgi:protein-S-isoprenylcysteine O-methyltransferase Ste14
MDRPPVAPDHSGVVVPPPLIYLVFFLVGVGLQRFVPVPPLPIGAARVVGGVLALLWVLLTAWSFRRFWSAGTSVIPVRPTTALVVEGPYRFTRNPMYVGLLLLYTGVACWFGLVWPLLLAPVLVWVIGVWVIAREERYLDRKFGQEYRQYRSQVRRWL